MIGANGAGKTTLFNVVTGDFPATAGRVRFFGDDVTLLPPYERVRAGLRRTYQSSLLFRELTVRDNLFLAVRGVARGRFSLLQPRARQHDDARPPTTCCVASGWKASPTSASPCCRTASSGSSRSAWRSPARRD